MRRLGKFPSRKQVFIFPFQKTASQYENNVLGIYDKYRTDENEPIPNIQKIRDSVDKYIECNNSDEKLNDILEMCQNNDVLFVHLRSGDRGIASSNFLNKIENLSKKYRKIVILCGIHKNTENIRHLYPSVEDSIKNTQESLENLFLKNLNIQVDLNEPDIHLSAMRRAKNLLVHQGSYSMLGALLFSGENLYVTDELPSLNNKDFFQHVTHYELV